MYKLGTASMAHLDTCHRNLQRVVLRAIQLSDVDFSVVEGKRTPEKQRENIANGVSWTMDSKHVPEFDDPEDWLSEAVDIYPWVGGKTDQAHRYYKRIAKAMFAAALELEINIEWGGFWNDPQEDEPHWQLG